MSASANRRFTRSVKRVIVAGGRGGDRRSRSASIAGLLGRLRRLELAMLHITGHREFAASNKIDGLDNMLEQMYNLVDVESPIPSGAAVQGNAVPLPHEGPPDRETEGEG